MPKEEMFKNIIGYEDVKTTLKRIVDVLNNKEKYKKLDVKVPHGLLLYGPAGTGKTSIANEFVKSTNRKSFVVRKTKPNGSFINYLNNTFDKACKNQPSIIILEDLDKYSDCTNGRATDAEEYVTIQSLIDKIVNDDVFVIATVNDKNKLPDSLTRAGRFDIKMKIDYPKEKDSVEIFKYYLRNKKIDKNVKVKNIAYILTNSSCADLEKVCNQAGLYAGYLNKRNIGMDELLKASLELKYNTTIEDLNTSNKYDINTAYHEAGHALVAELLEPGSVALITILKCDSDTRGMTIFRKNDNYFEDIKYMENRIKSLLSGKAATEIIYNKCDVGVYSDMRKVYEIVRRIVDDYCMFDFDSWFYDSSETSEKVKEHKDEMVNKLIDKFYVEVKEMLFRNKDKLDKLSNVLAEKKILFQDEIEKILA